MKLRVAAKEAVSCPICGARIRDTCYCERCWERGADLDLLVARHRRYWDEVKRRRERYGYGLLGRVREWWGER